MKIKKRMSQKEIAEKSGPVPSANKIEAMDDVPSANKVKGAELSIRANLSALKKQAKSPVPSADKLEVKEDVPQAKLPSSKYKQAIQKRLKK
jgi:transcriptional regulator with XRE-family HTH domain